MKELTSTAAPLQESSLRLLSRKELRALKGITYSDMHLYRLEKDKKFPRRIKIGAHSIAWVEAEINDWIKARIAERDAD